MANAVPKKADETNPASGDAIRGLQREARKVVRRRLLSRRASQSSRVGTIIVVLLVVVEFGGLIYLLSTQRPVIYSGSRETFRETMVINNETFEFLAEFSSWTDYLIPQTTINSKFGVLPDTSSLYNASYQFVANASQAHLAVSNDSYYPFVPGSCEMTFDNSSRQTQGIWAVIPFFGECNLVSDTPGQFTITVTLEQTPPSQPPSPAIPVGQVEALNRLVILPTDAQVNLIAIQVNTQTALLAIGIAVLSFFGQTVSIVMLLRQEYNRPWRVLKEQEDEDLVTRIADSVVRELASRKGSTSQVEAQPGKTDDGLDR